MGPAFGALDCSGAARDVCGTTGATKIRANPHMPLSAGRWSLSRRSSHRRHLTKGENAQVETHRRCGASTTFAWPFEHCHSSLTPSSLAPSLLWSQSKAATAPSAHGHFSWRTIAGLQHASRSTASSTSGMSHGTASTWTTGPSSVTSMPMQTRAPKFQSSGFRRLVARSRLSPSTRKLAKCMPRMSEKSLLYPTPMSAS
mmetsp:Transcript_24580/g.84357  ORF Transcript_24580/g.84357 Transcript_24580/m.84357 type:complete len:200 (+) Transcript_24580:66-665(+)